MSNQPARPQAIVETVEEYLARGGVIQRIEDYPDPSDRVILRGRRYKGQSGLGSVTLRDVSAYRSLE